mgnify:CR=1 FL=1
MSVRTILAPGLGFALLFAACGDDTGSGFSATAPTGITSASQSTSTGAGASTSTGGPDDPTTTGATTSSASNSTTPPCAELTLCPDVTSNDPTSPPDTTADPTLPASDTGDTGDTGVPGDPCNGAGDGDYCGAALGGLADHNSVYHCSGGTTTSADPCPAGCENNACKQVAQDPCASAQSGNGKYCGGTLMGGDAGALYNCQNGGTADKQTCSNGCKVNPPGIADACNPEGDPCSGAASGDGPYCGGGLPTGDPNVLYQCVGKATQSSQTCAEGCQQNPPGVPDECKKVQNGGECCLDVPPGVVELIGSVHRPEAAPTTRRTKPVDPEAVDTADDVDADQVAEPVAGGARAAHQRAVEEVDLLHLPSAPLCPTTVHASEHQSPIARLRPPCTRINT